jgi:hypothetical protein
VVVGMNARPPFPFLQMRRERRFLKAGEPDGASGLFPAVALTRGLGMCGQTGPYRKLD